VALQNVFELLSFASTIVFPKLSQFRYPVVISFGAIVVSACCFAGYVRKERGHLLHMSKCIKREKRDELEHIQLGDSHPGVAEQEWIA
jgi:iron-regulated transporter 1